MEPVTAMSRGEWSSFSGMYSTDEEADFMTQLLHNSSLSNELPVISSSNFESTMNTNNSMYFSSQENSYNDCRSYPFSHPSHFSSFLMSNDSSLTMEYSNMVEGEILSSPSNKVLVNNLIEVSDFFNQDVSNDSIESGENMPKDVLQLERDEKFSQDKVYSPPESSKKRSRLPGDVAKNKRSVKLKKNIESTNEMDGEKKTVLQRKNSMISCCSEDESNVSHELNGKTRASRGSATDPQSLYARKRRERINERLRILQSLVPNGTKVDISTMLEEAVQYVKFLQLQIKLLSSDDLWMYSPIAYNGMDIGLDMKLGIPKS